MGSIITKTLGRSALELAALAASHFLPISQENRPKLVSDLERDPFFDHAINHLMCQLYHNYGMFLSPFMASVITARYCDFRQEYLPKISQQNGGNEYTDYISGGTMHVTPKHRR